MNLKAHKSHGLNGNYQTLQHVDFSVCLQSYLHIHGRPPILFVNLSNWPDAEIDLILKHIDPNMSAG